MELEYMKWLVTLLAALGGGGGLIGAVSGIISAASANAAKKAAEREKVPLRCAEHMTKIMEIDNAIKEHGTADAARDANIAAISAVMAHELGEKIKQKVSKFSKRKPEPYMSVDERDDLNREYRLYIALGHPNGIVELYETAIKSFKLRGEK